jgi:hypothetical protein
MNKYMTSAPPSFNPSKPSSDIKMATTTQTETSQADGFELRNLESSGYSANDTEPPHSSNKPTKAELLKISSAGFSFFVAGVNDGSLGALIPHIIRDYDVTTAIVSSV